MPQTISIRSKGRAHDLGLRSFYAFLWGSHAVFGAIILSGAWFATESERPLILAWCALVVVMIPLALLMMRRTQDLEATEHGLTIVGAGFPFVRTVEVPRSKTVELTLESGCWGAYHLLILRWGRLPWQSVFLAPLTDTNEKRSIGASVVAFLDENNFKSKSSLTTP
jgi:hypothetical protein